MIGSVLKRTVPSSVSGRRTFPRRLVALTLREPATEPALRGMRLAAMALADLALARSSALASLGRRGTAAARVVADRLGGCEGAAVATFAPLAFGAARAGPRGITTTPARGSRPSRRCLC